MCADLRIRDVWNWSTFQDYIVFLVAFTALLAALAIVLGQPRWYTVTLGIVSLVVESSLAVPQVRALSRQCLT